MSYRTAAEIAEALHVSKTAVLRRAGRERWPYTELASRGGQLRIYQLKKLPEEVRASFARAPLAPRRRCKHKLHFFVASALSAAITATIIFLLRP